MIYNLLIFLAGLVAGILFTSLAAAAGSAEKCGECKRKRGNR